MHSPTTHNGTCDGGGQCCMYQACLIDVSDYCIALDIHPHWRSIITINVLLLHCLYCNLWGIMLTQVGIIITAISLLPIRLARVHKVTINVSTKVSDGWSYTAIIGNSKQYIFPREQLSCSLYKEPVLCKRKVWWSLWHGSY